MGRWAGGGLLLLTLLLLRGLRGLLGLWGAAVHGWGHGALLRAILWSGSLGVVPWAGGVTSVCGHSW